MEMMRQQGFSGKSNRDMSEIAFRPSLIAAGQPANVAAMRESLAAAKDQARMQGDVASPEELLDALEKSLSRLELFHGGTQGELIAWMRTALNSRQSVDRSSDDVQEVDSKTCLSLYERLAHWAKFGANDADASDAEEASRSEESLLLLAQRTRTLSLQQRQVLDEREFYCRGWEAVAECVEGDVDLAKRLWVQSLLKISVQRESPA